MLYLNGEKVAQIVPGSDGITFNNSGTDLSSTNVEDAIKELNNKIATTYLTDSVTISSMPFTHAVTGLTADHHCIRMELGTPSAQTSDWSVTTTSGSYTITGTLATSGSTTAVLGFAR